MYIYNFKFSIEFIFQLVITKNFPVTFNYCHNKIMIAYKYTHIYINIYNIKCNSLLSIISTHMC